MGQYADILMQAPLVGMFMIFMWHNAREWRLHMADRDKAFAQALDGVTSKHEQVLDKVSTRLESALDNTAVQINVLSKLLLYHDATVRGINPDIKGGTDEIERLLQATLKGRNPDGK